MARLSLRPTGKALFSREHELRVMQRDRLAQLSFVDAGPMAVMAAEPGYGFRVAGPQVAEQLAGLLLLLFRIHGAVRQAERGISADGARPASVLG